jgi:hypothetical protein
VKPHIAPYAKILTHASDRVFLKPVWLGPDLDRDAANTLYLISANPEVFGDVRPSLTDRARQDALSNLLTAAKAYVAAERKHSTRPVPQAELPL